MPQIDIGSAEDGLLNKSRRLQGELVAIYEWTKAKLGPTIAQAEKATVKGQPILPPLDELRGMLEQSIALERQLRELLEIELAKL